MWHDKQRDFELREADYSRLTNNLSLRRDSRYGDHAHNGFDREIYFSKNPNEDYILVTEIRTPTSYGSSDEHPVNVKVISADQRICDKVIEDISRNVEVIKSGRVLEVSV